MASNNSSKTAHVMNLLSKNRGGAPESPAAEAESAAPQAAPQAEPQAAPAAEPAHAAPVAPIISSISADAAVSSQIKDALEAELLETPKAAPRPPVQQAAPAAAPVQQPAEETPAAPAVREASQDSAQEPEEEKLAELSAACNAAITAGCDVTLLNGDGHISLTAEDQINLSTATAAVAQGAVGYPYHLDSQLCAIFPAADIQTMARAATAHKLYQTTYYNHLAAWVRRCETAEVLAAITYGAELPQDLEDNMAAILGAANEA